MCVKMTPSQADICYLFFFAEDECQTCVEKDVTPRRELEKLGGKP